MIAFARRFSNAKMQLLRVFNVFRRRRCYYLIVIFLLLLNFSAYFNSLRIFKLLFYIISNKKEILNEFNKQIAYKEEFQEFLAANAQKKTDAISAIARNNRSNYENLNHLCPFIPPNLVGRIDVEETEFSFEALNKKYESMFNASSGGHWKPKECQAYYKVAIIVPYRDRELHLKLFLNHMHKILPNQLIDYSIYIIELVCFINYIVVPRLVAQRALEKRKK